MASLLGATQKPNIVVFISDDLGRWDTSIHGSKDARTPTMERLAAEGMTFDDAYVASPSCCPSRFSLLTGLMPARHGAHPNHSKVKTGNQISSSHFEKDGLPHCLFRQDCTWQ
jgi:arylsulfatase A-like enzyme